MKQTKQLPKRKKEIKREKIDFEPIILSLLFLYL
jgi:hypothetical protein